MSKKKKKTKKPIRVFSLEQEALLHRYETALWEVLEMALHPSDPDTRSNSERAIKDIIKIVKKALED